MRLARNTARVLKRFAKLPNYPVQLENNGRLARWTLPGFSYYEFNRAGYPSVDKLIMIMDHSRNMSQPEFMTTVGPNSNTPNVVLVMFAQHMDVALPLYERSACHFPMTVDWTMYELGRTSMVAVDTIREKSTGDTMLRTLRKYVYVDLMTRQPCVWPDVIRERYKDFTVEKKDQEKFPKMPVLKVPRDHFSSEVRITHSELDQLFHTNQSHYLKYSMDSASQAAEAGLLRRFNEDLCFYHAKNVHVIHRGESFAGDRLTVHGWQDSDDPDILKFVIRKGDTDIYNAIVTMFPEM